MDRGGDMSLDSINGGDLSFKQGLEEEVGKLRKEKCELLEKVKKLEEIQEEQRKLVGDQLKKVARLEGELEFERGDKARVISSLTEEKSRNAELKTLLEKEQKERAELEVLKNILNQSIRESVMIQKDPPKEESSSASEVECITLSDNEAEEGWNVGNKPQAGESVIKGIAINKSL